LFIVFVTCNAGLAEFVAEVLLRYNETVVEKRNHVMPVQARRLLEHFLQLPTMHRTSAGIAADANKINVPDTRSTPRKNSGERALVEEQGGV
jgi:hypothetical protein